MNCVSKEYVSVNWKFLVMHVLTEDLINFVLGRMQCSFVGYSAYQSPKHVRVCTAVFYSVGPLAFIFEFSAWIKLFFNRHHIQTGAAFVGNFEGARSGCASPRYGPLDYHGSALVDCELRFSLTRLSNSHGKPWAQQWRHYEMYTLLH
jgi:hypothetical protein